MCIRDRSGPQLVGDRVLTVIAAADHIRPVFFRRLIQPLQIERGDIIIAVHKGDIFPPGSLNPCVSRFGNAAVFLVDHASVRKSAGKSTQDFQGMIGRAVIHQNNLEALQGLRLSLIHISAEREKLFQ